MKDDFDWTDREHMILATPDVAVYNNSDGDLVIRQQGDLYEKDKWVVIPQDCGPRLIAALIEILKEQEHQSVTVVQPGGAKKDIETIIRLPKV